MALTFSHGIQALLPTASPIGAAHDTVYGRLNCSAAVLGLLQAELRPRAAAEVLLMQAASWLSPLSPPVGAVHPVPSGGWLTSNQTSSFVPCVATELKSRGIL